MKSELFIHFCTNDDGTQLVQLTVEDPIEGKETCLHLESVYMLEGPEFSFEAGRIICIYGERFKCWLVSEMVGNRYWNRYCFPLNYGLAFLNHLKLKNQFSAQMAYVELMEAWDGPNLLTAKDFGFPDDVEPTGIDYNQLKLFT